MFITIFLITSAFFIIANENIRLNNSENIDTFVYTYANWLGSLVKNTNNLAGFLIKLEWLPETGNDSTNETE